MFTTINGIVARVGLRPESINNGYESENKRADGLNINYGNYRGEMRRPPHDWRCHLLSGPTSGLMRRRPHD